MLAHLAIGFRSTKETHRSGENKTNLALGSRGKVSDSEAYCRIQATVGMGQLKKF